MSLLQLPHHDGSALYVSNPYPDLGERVALFVRVPAGSRVRAVHVRCVVDGEPHFETAVIDRTEGSVTWWRASVEVHNPVLRYRFLLDDSGIGYEWLTASGIYPHDVTDAGDFQLTTFAPPPSWARDSVFYEIFPDRFARDESRAPSLPAWAVPSDWDAPVIADKTVQSRQVYGGNLAGIERRLDYIAGLGVNALYLTPFFPAGSAHRYDAASFDRVDPVLGGDSALVRLVATMHARGMRIIGDLTTNHTGDLHDWHQAARAYAGAAEAGFYYWQRHPDEYSSWLGVRSLPKLNHGSAELSRRMIEGPESVVGRWLRPPYSLDGWRIDVANMTGRHADDDLTTRVARGIRSTIAQVNPEALLIAEHAHDASDDLAGDGWHGTMNYAGLLRPVWAWLGEQPPRRNFLGVPARVPCWSGSEAVRTMRLFHSSVPWAVASHNFNLIGSHDTARIRTVTGDPHRVEAAAGLLFTMVGLPMVFAGDELGLEGEDPEDARRPMPWHRPESWHAPTLNAYRSLATLRRSSTALRTGGLRWAHVGEDSVGFVRESAQEKLLVMVSRSAHAPVSLDTAALGLDGEAENVYGDSPLKTADGEARFAADRPGVQVWRLH